MYSTFKPFLTIDSFKNSIMADLNYQKSLFTYVINMFKYSGLPDDIPIYYPEMVAAERGNYGVFMDDNGIIITRGNYTGMPDRYGHGREYIGTTMDGKTYRGTVGVDVFVVPNNATELPDSFIINRYSNMLAQIDISMYCALINSRAGNIFIADSDTERAKVETAMKDVEDGRSAIITGSRVKDDILDTKKMPLETIQLTNVNSADKIQYLSRFRDDIMGAFLAQYGIDTGNVNKGTQILENELKRMAEACDVNIDERYNLRRQAWEQINKTFGTNVEIIVNPIYKQGVTKNEQTGKTDSTKTGDDDTGYSQDSTNVSE